MQWWTSTKTRSIIILCLALFVILAFAGAETQVVGKVVTRSGSAQAGCQVEFSGPAIYRVTTNNDGNFFLSNPQYGSYSVLLRQGQLQARVNVTIDARGLRPPTLVVNW